MRDPWAYQRGQMWVLDWEHESPASVRPRIPASFTEITEEDVETLLAATGPSAEETVRDRLESDRRCFSARVDGKLAAYGWVTPGPEWIGEMEHRLGIPPEEAYIWDCVTLPKFRRNRLYSALLSEMARRLRAEGFRRAWIGSNEENRPSIRGFEIAGFRPVAEMTYARLFRLKILKTSPAPHAEPGLVDHLVAAIRGPGERRWGRWLIGFRR